MERPDETAARMPTPDKTKGNIYSEGKLWKRRPYDDVETRERSEVRNRIGHLWVLQFTRCCEAALWLFPSTCFPPPFSPTVSCAPSLCTPFNINIFRQAHLTILFWSVAVYHSKKDEIVNPRLLEIMTTQSLVAITSFGAYGKLSCTSRVSSSMVGHASFRPAAMCDSRASGTGFSSSTWFPVSPYNLHVITWCSIKPLYELCQGSEENREFWRQKRFICCCFFQSAY